MRLKRSCSMLVGGVLLILLLGGMAPPPPASAIPDTPLQTISIDPTSGPPGRRALVTGSFPGYGLYDSVVLWWDDIYSGRRLGDARLRSDGSFVLEVAIPPEASAGAHQVWADVNYGYEQASTGFSVSAADRSAAYIYNNDLATANDFKALLDGNGVNTTLIQLDNVAGTSFAPYDLILIGRDTGAGYDWSGSAAARGKIQYSGKPVLGLGQGGASLFQELDLYINYGHSWISTNDTQVYAHDPGLTIWEIPYHIYVPPEQLVTIYSTGSTALDVYLPTPVDRVFPLGRQHDHATHYPLIAEAGRYVLWGFYGGPNTMTQAGRDLLINIIWQLMWATDVDTLILTDYDRMQDLGYSLADVVALENDFQYLMGLPQLTTNMTALHRDLSDHAPSTVQTACGSWEGNEGDVSATNTCVEAIDDYVESLKGGFYPNIDYLIIVGAHEVIPMKAREQDHLISAQEENWGNGLPGAASYMHQLYSTPGTNGWGHYLTDSIYGDLSYIDDGWGTDHELIPELAVGRLVETPAQISDLIDTYIASNGRFSRANRVSIASSDYVDGGTLAANDMDPGTDDALVQSNFNSTDVPPKLNAANDLVYFGGHGNYNSISTGGGDAFMAGNHATRGDTAALGDMPDGVIVTSGCHNGVNFGNRLYHSPDAGTTYSEFPEEFAERLLGVYVGATGYTIISGTGADTDVTQVRHNEKLSTYVIKHLDQDGYITAGEAFRRAINSYVTDVGSIGTVERRVIAITTFYGIPNYRPPFLLRPIWPRWYEYWMEPILVDPPPYVDPTPFRFRVELILHDWVIHQPGPGPEWYLEIPGAIYGGHYWQPLLPVFKAGVVLPPGSTIEGVEWDQDGSESISWTADGPMMVPAATDDPLRGQLPPLSAPASQQIAQSPMEPYAFYTTTTSGGAGTLAGLSIIPLEHNPKTLSTTLWVKLAFTVTCQAGPSSDADGDGLPAYWEGSTGLDDNDAEGDNGAAGDPENDGLPNDQEFLRGTDPLDPDSDEDGWSDGVEVAVGSNPLNPGSKPSLVFLPYVAKAHSP